MSRSPEVQAVCDAAADRLERVGWTQRMGADPVNGGECLVRSTSEAGLFLYGASRGWDVGYSTQRVLARELGVSGVSEWNDKPGRTLAQVLDFLRNGTVVP